MQLGKKLAKEFKVLIIDMKRVPYIDQSGLYALESIILNIEQNNVQVFLLQLQKQPSALMRNINLIPDVIDESSLFYDYESCTNAVVKYIKENNL
jgi:SulP family sulfate permease